MIKMVYKVILPVIDDNLNILYYLDAEENRYETIEELLTSDSEIRLFFNRYELFYMEFEKWAKKNNLTFKFSDNSPYCGHTKNYNWVACEVFYHSLKSDPDIKKCKGYYNGHKFFCHNLKTLIREESNDFDVPMSRLKAQQEYMDHFVSCVVPLCRKKDNYFPTTLAAASREILPNPFSLRDIDVHNLMMRMRSAAVGGLYYVKDTQHRYKIIYDYDISSMYPFLLVNKMYPNLNVKPLYFKKFKKIKPKELGFYHVVNITAFLKAKHFPTVFVQKELQERLSNYGSCEKNAICLREIPEIEGWITSLDYDMLLRDYDIDLLEIDQTYIYTELVKGEKYFSSLERFYDKKQQSKGYIRTMYKVIIDSYSGSLTMKAKPSFVQKELIDNRLVLRVSKAAGDTPTDLYAFMTAYGRQMISDLGLKAGYDNVISIDTDGIFSTNRELDKYCGEGLGSLRLDKIMSRAKWFGQKQYEYKDENGEWTPTIAGLPAYLYEHGKMDYQIPAIVFDKKQQKYIKKSNNFKLGGKDEIR